VHGRPAGEDHDERDTDRPPGETEAEAEGIDVAEDAVPAGAKVKPTCRSTGCPSWDTTR
jgi:hypothetical protein